MDETTTMTTRARAFQPAEKNATLLPWTAGHATMDGVFIQRTQQKSMQRIFMRQALFQLILFTTAALAGTSVGANTLLLGGFTGTANVERVELVAPLALPEWREDVGTRLEIAGTFVQTATGEVSVVIRLFDSDEPLILTWHGAEGFQLVPPAGLPQNIPATPAQSNPQTVEWRLRFTPQNNATHRVHVDVQQPDGSWQVLLGRADVPLAIRDWYEAGAVSKVGIAGPVEFGNLKTRFFRAGTLLILK